MGPFPLVFPKFMAVFWDNLFFSKSFKAKHVKIFSQNKQKPKNRISGFSGNFPDFFLPDFQEKLLFDLYIWE